MTKISHISCVIIAKDAQKTLPDVLQALRPFEEVILYSNNSTDKTDEIAKSFANVTLIQGDFLGFGPTKNAAASYATNAWVFSLDADEVVSQEFIKNLAGLALREHTLYSILRTNYYKDKPVKHCWADDEIIRLYNKNETAFTNKHVHEHIISDGFSIKKLKGSVKHYPYTTISEFIIKADRYSTLFAQNHVGKKSSSPTKAFFNGAFSFVKTYFIKRGFLDGYAGLLIAYSHMVTNFYKYLKLYELNKEAKK